MQRRPIEISAISAILLACALDAVPVAHAKLTPLASEFQINHADPESSIPGPAARNAKPLEFGYFIQDLVTFAEAAAKSGDHQAESRYYRAFTKAVPDSSVGFSRLCESLEAAGQRAEAVAACRQALGLPGAMLKDYVRFVHLILSRDDRAPAELPPAELEDVKQVVAHLRQHPETAVAGSHMQCELGTRLESIALLEECTTALAAVAPGDPKTIAFQWALAVRKGDQQGARRLIERARTTGMKPEGIARMERATLTLGHAWGRWLSDWRALLAAAVLAVLACGCAYLVYIARARHQRMV
ncbi:MAG: hypothetical protein ABJA82_01605 [Myxococcales bacterium]